MVHFGEHIGRRVVASGTALLLSSAAVLLQQLRNREGRGQRPGGDRIFQIPPPNYRGGGRVIGSWARENLGGVAPVLREEDCDATSSDCGTYAWVQGTSMATPNTAGVAALIISQYGDFTPDNSQKIHMTPTSVESILQITANNQPCPQPRTVSYSESPAPLPTSAQCNGGTVTELLRHGHRRRVQGGDRVLPVTRVRSGPASGRPSPFRAKVRSAVETLARGRPLGGYFAPRSGYTRRCRRGLARPGATAFQHLGGALDLGQRAPAWGPACAKVWPPPAILADSARMAWSALGVRSGW